MSFAILPDPHPGRCRNYRAFTVAYDVQNLRCLDYEGTEHVCRFAESVPYNWSAVTTTSSSTPKPTPWVSPLEKDGQK